MSAPPRFLNSVYDKFPDDDSTKKVHFQAAGLVTQTGIGIGDRHVLLWWLNFNNLMGSNPSSESSRVIQIVQLTGQPGNYAYYSPVAQMCDDTHEDDNMQILLGEFTRAQRDRMLELAKEIRFERRSVVNSCRVWTRDLLEEMVGEGLISRETFEDVDGRTPLMCRWEEV
jgi:hypothetical protein